MRHSFISLIVSGALLGAGVAHGQSSGPAVVKGTIAWGTQVEVPGPVREGVTKARVPSFVGAFWAKDGREQLYALRLDGNVTQGTLQNTVYEPFSAADAKLLARYTLPASPTLRFTQGIEAKRPVSQLVLAPWRRNPQTGQPERLVSFECLYQAGPATARRGSSTRPHADHSVLRTGDWFKLGVAESGIYKLDKAALNNLGMNANSINPNNLKFYGNSMGILPQPNATYRPDDLAENAILFVGDGNSVFDDNEYFLFYSPGPHTWEAKSGLFQHRNNFYSDTTYYFVTVGSGSGRRVSATAGPSPSGNEPTISTFTERRFYEHDLVNILHSGRQWLGEGFNTTSTQKDFTFSGLNDLVPNSPLRITSSAGANAFPSSSTFAITLNGTAVGNQSVSPRPNVGYGADVITSLTTLQTTLPATPGTDLRVGLSFANAGDATALGYLDYLEINAQRQLRFSGPAMEFRSLENISAGAVSRFVLGNASSGVAVWDVTNPRRAVAQTLDNSGTFLANTDTLREFVALQPGTNFPTPRPFGRVANQDLHALDGNLDLVIVTYPAFRGEAERLANHRRSHDNLRVAVVTTTEVYNEFSSGGQDVTAIRDLMKQVYDRAPAGKYQSLLLFGDASFDYKSSPFNDRNYEPNWWKTERVPFKTSSNYDAFNQNYVPTYESRESFAPFYGVGDARTYSSEDYFAYLDDSEGYWEETNPDTSERMDIGVGRLPVRTPVGDPHSTTQAHQMVDKIIGYDNPSSYGKWRNRITLSADDGPPDDGYFVKDSEPYATAIKANYPAYNVHKTYLDLYPQISVAAGQRSPAANQAIDESFEKGSLLWNYLGHGGPKGLADEQILTNASVLALQNANNLSFMVTGTCDLSTYDNPDAVSAGEQVLVDNATGGVVGLFTTTRVVDAGQNSALVGAFFDQVLLPINSSGEMPRMGYLIMRSKNRLPGSVNSRNYTLMGDPSMKLAYPEQEVVIDRINAAAVGSASLDTLHALSRITLHGEVRSGGVRNTGFSGNAQVTIYDKPTTVMTLGDGGDPPVYLPIEVQESVIYAGQATVTNGEFSLSFVVPKDINYKIGLGKISLYAGDATHKVDGHGYLYVPVGGAQRGAAADNLPPKIQLFMDNYSFYSGGLTAQNTTLLAKLSDENGINTTGAGIGHEITAVIDRDPNKLLILNDAYASLPNDFTQGKLNNLYKELAVGPHSITLKAWDTYNNSSEATIEFVVAHNEQLALDHVLNYPNPFSGNTTFHFDQNREGDDLDVQVQIFTVGGQLVRTLRASILGSEPHQKGISWNGRDEFDGQLARGVYVYRVSVRTPRDGSTASKFEKLVILN